MNRIVLCLVVMAVLVLPMAAISVSADEETNVYRNTGDFYYAHDDTDHNITVSRVGNKAVINSDGWIKEIEMDRYWILPILVYSDNGVYDTITIECTTVVMPSYESTSFERVLHVEPTGGEIVSDYPLTITVRHDPESSIVWWAYNGSTFLRQGSTSPELYISETGSHVYSDKPIVKSDTDMFVFGGTEIRTGTPQNGLCGTASFFTIGTIDELRANIQEFSSLYMIYYEYRNVGTDNATTYNYGILEGSYNVSPVRTTDSAYGVRYNGITIGMVWHNDFKGNEPMKVHLTQAIVPVEVTGSGSDPDIYYNTGNYHYDDVTDDIIQHISISSSGNMCTISSSYGWVKQIRMNSYWIIPIFTTSTDEVYFLECTPLIPNSSSGSFSYGLKFVPCESNATPTTTYEIEIWGDKNVYVYRGEQIFFEGQLKLLLSEDVGKYVYAERPVIKGNTNMVLVGGMCRTYGNPNDGWYLCGSDYSASGMPNDLKNDLQNISSSENYIKTLYQNQTSAPSDVLRAYTMVQDSLTISDAKLTENAYGYKFDGITVGSDWSWGTDVRHMDVELNKAIVPVEITSSSGGDGDDSGYNPLPSENLWFIFALGIPACIVVGIVLIFKR